MTTKHWTLTAATLLAAHGVGGGPLPAAPATAMPKVTVVGISIVGPGLGLDGKELRPLSQGAGTRIALAARVSPPQRIVELDSDTSAVEVSDSGGHPLRMRIGHSAEIAKDGSVALIEIEGSDLPATGAGKLTLRGSLAMSVASGTRTLKVPNVRLEQGRSIRLGSETVTLGEIEVGLGFLVPFKGTQRAVESIKSVLLRDAQGATGAHDWGNRWARTSDYMGGVEVAFRLDSTTRDGSLEFELWENRQKLAVPLDLTAGLAVAGP
jgi:hypothetical protein